MKVGDVIKFTYNWMDATMQPPRPEIYSECGIICEVARGGEMVTYYVTNCNPDNRFNTLGAKVSQYVEDLELISESG